MAASSSAWSPGHALHALEGHLRDARARIDAQRLGEQLLTFGVVRAAGGPRAQERDRLVGLLLSTSHLATRAAAARLSDTL